jgi:phosphopantothenoylcysteine synthetase/decarboxylase
VRLHDNNNNDDDDDDDDDDDGEDDTAVDVAALMDMEMAGCGNNIIVAAVLDAVPTAASAARRSR